MSNIKQTTKFYQPSPVEVEDQKINNIITMMDQQQKNISDLLNKYNDFIPKDDFIDLYSKNNTQENIKENHKNSTLNNNKDSNKNNKDSNYSKDNNYNHQYITIDPLKNQQRLIKKRSSLHKKRSLTKLSKYVELPEIISKDTDKYIKKKKQRQLTFSKNPYFMQIQKLTQRQKIRESLSRAYSHRKQKKSSRHTIGNKSKQRSGKEPIKNDQGESSKKSSSNQEEGISVEEPEYGKQFNIPQPIAYYKKAQQDYDSSSSDEGEVPLTYYTRQYREALKGQTLEEINYLYFSKNQSMSEWTQGILSLFQKHDKQLVSIRKRCKYLTKFDANFFSVDIFRDN